MHAEFPRRFRAAVEIRGVDAEEAVEMIRQISSAALAHANDPDLAAENQAHREPWEAGLERERREQAGAAAAEDDDAMDHARE